jgi:hypothetical protein
VNVVDLEGHARVLSNGYSSMEGLAWSTSGRSVLFSATVNGSEYVVYEAGLDGKTRVSARGLGFATLHDVAPDGTWAVTHDEMPMRLVSRPAGAKEEVDLSWLDSAYEPTLSGDGRTLALCDESVLAGAAYSAVARPATGGPIVRLGDGIPEQFSPDGRSVLVVVPTSPPHIMSYPLGTGDPVRMDAGDFEDLSCVRWMPDGSRLLICGNRSREPSRCFLLDPASHRAERVGPDGLWECFPSPDGARFAARSQDGWLLCSVTGEESRPIPGMTAGDEVIRWDHRGGSLFCFERGAVPSKVDRIDVRNGRRETVATVADRDAAGLVAVLSVTMADDLASLVYGAAQYSSTLYTVSPSSVPGVEAPPDRAGP